MAGGRIRFVGVAVAMAIALTSASPALSSHRTTRTYVGGHDPFLYALLWWSTGVESGVTCRADAPVSVPGTACFVRPLGTTEVEVDFAEVSGLPVTGELSFRDANGRRLAPGHRFCDHTSIRVPDGATHVLVAASMYQTECSTGAPATGGTVTAGFR